MGGAHGDELLKDVGPAEGHERRVESADFVPELNELAIKHDVFILDQFDASTAQFMGPDASTRLFYNASERHVVVSTHEANSAGHPELKVHGSVTASADERATSFAGQPRVRGAQRCLGSCKMAAQGGGSVQCLHIWAGAVENDNTNGFCRSEVQAAEARARAAAGSSSGGAPAQPQPQQKAGVERPADSTPGAGAAAKARPVFKRRPGAGAAAKARLGTTAGSNGRGTASQPASSTGGAQAQPQPQQQAGAVAATTPDGVTEELPREEFVRCLEAALSRVKARARAAAGSSSGGGAAPQPASSTGGAQAQTQPQQQAGVKRPADSPPGAGAAAKARPGAAAGSSDDGTAPQPASSTGRAPAQPQPQQQAGVERPADSPPGAGAAAKARLGATAGSNGHGTASQPASSTGGAQAQPRPQAGAVAATTAPDGVTEELPPEEFVRCLEAASAHAKARARAAAGSSGGSTAPPPGSSTGGAPAQPQPQQQAGVKRPADSPPGAGAAAKTRSRAAAGSSSGGGGAPWPTSSTGGAPAQPQPQAGAVAATAAPDGATEELSPQFVHCLEAAFIRAKAEGRSVRIAWANDLDWLFTMWSFGADVVCLITTNAGEFTGGSWILGHVVVLEPAMKALGLTPAAALVFKAFIVDDYLPPDGVWPIGELAGYNKTRHAVQEFNADNFSLQRVLGVILGLLPTASLPQRRAVLASFVDMFAQPLERRPPWLRGFKPSDDDKVLLAKHGLFGAIIAEQVMRHASASDVARMDSMQLQLDVYGNGEMYATGLPGAGNAPPPLDAVLPPVVAALRAAAGNPARFQAKYAYLVLGAQPTAVRLSYLLDAVNVRHVRAGLVSEWQPFLGPGEQIIYERLKYPNSIGSWQPVGFVATSRAALDDVASTLAGQMQQETLKLAAELARLLLPWLQRSGGCDIIAHSVLDESMYRQLHRAHRGCLFDDSKGVGSVEQRMLFTQALEGYGVYLCEAPHVINCSWRTCMWAASSADAARALQLRQQQLYNAARSRKEAAYKQVSADLQEALASGARFITTTRSGCGHCFNSVQAARSSTRAMDSAEVPRHLRRMRELELLPEGYVLFMGPGGDRMLARDLRSANDALALYKMPSITGGLAELPGGPCSPPGEAGAGAAAGAASSSQSPAAAAPGAGGSSGQPPAAAKGVVTRAHAARTAVRPPALPAAPPGAQPPGGGALPGDAAASAGSSSGQPPAGATGDSKHTRTAQTDAPPPALPAAPPGMQPPGGALPGVAGDPLPGDAGDPLPGPAGDPQRARSLMRVIGEGGVVGLGPALAQAGLSGTWRSGKFLQRLLDAASGQFGVVQLQGRTGLENVAFLRDIPHHEVVARWEQRVIEKLPHKNQI